MKKKKNAMLEIEIFLIFWLKEIEILTKLIEKKIQGKLCGKWFALLEHMWLE